MKYEKTLRKLCRSPKLDVTQIESTFRKMSSVDVIVTPKNIGLAGFEIQTDEGLCFITERSIDYLNKNSGRATETQKKLLKFSIPIPRHIGKGLLIEHVDRISKSEDPNIEANLWLQESFGIDTAVVYFNKYFLKSDSFKEYKNIIFEAIEAYYIGLDHIAIMSLFPVFEAGLRNIQSKLVNGDLGNVSTESFDAGIKKMLISCGKELMPEYIWYPGKGYNKDVEIDFLTHVYPPCDVINAFRLFFKDVLYRPSNSPDFSNGFNRHLVVHLLKNDFNESSNFVRLFLALTQITFIESLYNRDLPILFPDSDESDEYNINYLQTLKSIFFASRRSLLEEKDICIYPCSPLVRSN